MRILTIKVPQQLHLRLALPACLVCLSFLTRACIPILPDKQSSAVENQIQSAYANRPVAPPQLSELGIAAAGWKSKEEAIQHEEQATIDTLVANLAALDQASPAAISQGAQVMYQTMADLPEDDAAQSARLEALLKGENPPEAPTLSRLDVIAEQTAAADEFHGQLQKHLPELDDTLLVALRIKMTLGLAAIKLQEDNSDPQTGIPPEILEHVKANIWQVRDQVNAELRKRGLTDQ
ncbi:MAG: hypothetical protein KDK39_05500 [Leptospiraceae bacterium]|nr:hypothetical protein [Leptospiraceae bacterium]